MGQNAIVIKGAREHNLKDIDVTIPRDKLVVITGLSGSGKSSLAFDTMYAEGQRRYVESLSSYARMFLGQMQQARPGQHRRPVAGGLHRPEDDEPSNPRSTVGTTTEIYDYLRLLFARVGVPHCPECGRRHQEADDRPGDRRDPRARARREGHHHGAGGHRSQGRVHQALRRPGSSEGFSRVRIDGEVVTPRRRAAHAQQEDQALHRRRRGPRPTEGERHEPHRRGGRARDQARRRARAGPGARRRRQAAWRGRRTPPRAPRAAWRRGSTSSRSRSPAPSTAIPWTSCSRATSRSTPPTAPAPTAWASAAARRSIRSLVIPDPSLSIAGRGRHGAVQDRATTIPRSCAPCAKHLGADAGHAVGGPAQEGARRHPQRPGQGEGPRRLRDGGRTRDVLVHRMGGRPRGGACTATRRPKATPSARRLQSYFAIVPCQTCHGKRLKPEILAVTVGGKSIHDVCRDERGGIATSSSTACRSTGQQERIAGPIVKEIKARLRFLVDVGLDYLTLERATATLSGGEAQRIRLATQIGAGAHGRALHPRRAVHRPAPARQRAAASPRSSACATSATRVIVVEHDEDTMPQRGLRRGHRARARASTAARSSPAARPRRSWRAQGSLTGRLPERAGASSRCPTQRRKPQARQSLKLSRRRGEQPQERRRSRFPSARSPS